MGLGLATYLTDISWYISVLTAVHIWRDIYIGLIYTCVYVYAGSGDISDWYIVVGEPSQRLQRAMPQPLVESHEVFLNFSWNFTKSSGAARPTPPVVRAKSFRMQKSYNTLTFKLIPHDRSIFKNPCKNFQKSCVRCRGVFQRGKEYKLMIWK